MTIYIAHVDRNIDKNMKKHINDQEIRKAIKVDIDIFQNNVETDSFLVVARLMVTKWKEQYGESVVNNFIKYFSKQWLSPKRMGWFDHFCAWTPVTDNALEGTNYHVKGPDGTYRDRLGVLQFCKELEDGFIKRWSTDRNPMVNYPDGREEPNLNLKVFHLEPLHKLPDLTTACQWGKLGKQFKKYKDVYNNVYYCTPGYDESNKELKIMSTAACEEWFERREFADWPTFDDFIKHSRTMRFLKVNEDHYKMSECSCSTWFKYYKCKHSIDLCSRLELFNYEERVRNVPIGANRRRGAPGKGKSALVFQPSEMVDTIFSDSDSEQRSKKSNKKGPKSKKDNDTSSDSEDSDFDIFANISPIRKAKTPTTTSSKQKTPKKVATTATKATTTKATTSKETATKATTSKETATKAKTKANSKQSGKKNSGFASRK